MKPVSIYGSGDTIGYREICLLYKADRGRREDKARYVMNQAIGAIIAETTSDVTGQT